MLWVISLAAGPALLLALAVREPPRKLGWDLVSWVLLVEAALTVAFGVALGVRRRWLDVFIGASAGTAVLVAVYVAAMLFQPNADGTEDQAAAVGTIVFGLPTYAVLVVLIGAGALGGRLLHRRRARLTEGVERS